MRLRKVAKGRPGKLLEHIVLARSIRKLAAARCGESWGRERWVVPSSRLVTSDTEIWGRSFRYPSTD